MSKSKYITYAHKTVARTSGRDCAPELKKASAARRKELKKLLVLISLELGDKPTLGSLAQYLNIGQDRLAHWLHWGEVPPWPAAKLTKDYELKRRSRACGGTMPEIRLNQLAPSLFLPK